MGLSIGLCHESNIQGREGAVEEILLRLFKAREKRKEVYIVPDSHKYPIDALGFVILPGETELVYSYGRSP